MCHDGVSEDDFNCLFCYCPLYAYSDCGGSYITLEDGTKDCSRCTKNHDKHSWKFVVNKLREVNEYKIKFNEVNKDD